MPKLNNHFEKKRNQGGGLRNILLDLYRIYPAVKRLPEYRIGLKLVEKYKCKKILDVGCGPGNFGKFLLEENLADTYACIDIRKIFRLKDPRARFIHADARNPPINGERYDCIVFMNSVFYIGIEHVRKYLTLADTVIIIDVNKKAKYIHNKFLDIVEGNLRMTPEETEEYLRNMKLKIVEKHCGMQFYIVAQR